MKANSLKEDRLLIIFYKNPVKGMVKTRLAAEIGKSNALKVYKYLSDRIRHSTEKADAVKVVYYSENIERDDIWNDEFYNKELQSGSNLGERMQNAFEMGFQSGYKKICIIGTDILDLSTAIIDEAFEKLNAFDHVIGPSKDGGYYLLGMNKLNESIFIDKAWGTNSVYLETINTIGSGKEKIYNLEVLFDIDIAEDLSEIKNIKKIIRNPN